MVDLVMWMMNMKPYEVIGYGNDITTKSRDMNYNDFATLSLKFENGIIAQIAAHGGCTHPHFHSLRIYGTKKTFLQSINSSVMLTSSDPQQEIENITHGYPSKETNATIIHSFIDSILDEGCDPIVTKDQVFDVMSVCFAAEEAIQENKPIKINYI